MSGVVGGDARQRSIPPAEGRMFETGQVEYPIHHGGRNLFGCFGEGVERRGGRANDSTSQRDCLHVANVNEVIGRFSGDQNEFPSFFEYDISGTGNEIAGHAVCDASQRTHGARNDDHRVVLSGAGGDGG